MTDLIVRAIGAPLDRIDGRHKVTGAATYAYEHAIEGAAYLALVQSTIAAGRIASVDATAAHALPGVLAVIWHENAPRLEPLVPAPPTFQDVESEALQSDVVAYRGQVVAAVVAETPEVAREAAGLLAVKYEEGQHDVELRAGRDDLETPPRINAGHPTDTAAGDVEAALAAAPVSLDQTYTTPATHNNPMEPHSTVAIWNEDGVTLYDSNQGPHLIRGNVARVFGLPPERVRVISPYIGGGFGSKVLPHPHLALAIMAARVAGRPVKLALTRQQMFAIAGYRTPTIQRIRLGADRDGRLTAISHDVVEQSSMAHRFAEQTAVPSRLMYAAANRRTTHRLARLHVPHPTFMRAPGECPGMFALESAMDEMAIACGLDPIELRIRNVPSAHPESGLPFSSHGLVACLREGAARFGWDRRDPQPGVRREGRWLLGSGVASATYPARRAPATAIARVDRDGTFRVLVGASDVGTGAWTVLTQIAADALGQPVERVRVEIGDTALPVAGGAGGSMGTASWGSAIVDAAQKLRARLLELDDVIPAGGLEAGGEAGPNPAAQQFAMHSFGAQFAEVRVDVDTGEVRVPRLLGVFAGGRIMNAKTARSQLLGGMTMGLSMALHEESILDPNLGDYANHDFASYHIAANADVGAIEVAWVEEEDPHLNPMGAKGLGEIGIVGTAAAIANAVHHATGVRVRDLPIRLDRLLDRRPPA
ncbi:MAG TPA: xanthine dehydrogenase family protein molybdopterin-binding subunit [Candidatus Dormibacteraeota bacterium]